jgi:hypothetical protein
MGHTVLKLILKKSLSRINKKIDDPSAFCFVLTLIQAFFLKTMLCNLFQAKCFKKSESVTHSWVTGGNKESIIYFKYLCCFSH